MSVQSPAPTSTAAKAALVTGASRGIGRAIALRLAADGYAVVVNYAGNAAAADAVVAEIRQAGGHAVAAQGDVADPEAMQRVFGFALQTYGRLDAVVNSAGVMP